MRIEIQWEMYDTAAEREFVGSAHEMTVTTTAQAQAWVREQLPSRETDCVEVDAVILSEIGEFADEDGEPMQTRWLGTYEPATEEWSWASR